MCNNQVVSLLGWAVIMTIFSVNISRRACVDSETGEWRRESHRLFAWQKDILALACVGGGVNRSCGCRRARVDDTEDIVNGGNRRLLSRVRPA
jgi:hypothetical protein